MSVTESTYYTTGADMANMINSVKIPMRNGDSLYFVNTVTLGDALIVSAVFLLLAFLVLQWLLNTVWRRR